MAGQPQQPEQPQQPPASRRVLSFLDEGLEFLRVMVRDFKKERAAHPIAWPAFLVRTRWLSAIEDELAVQFNLRLVAILTMITSAPDLILGSLAIVSHQGELRYYGCLVLCLGLLEVTGGALLLRWKIGALVIIAAELGFYLEAALGLWRYQRDPLSVTIFIVDMPIEAWVIWFLSHRKTWQVLNRWAAER